MGFSEHNRGNVSSLIGGKTLKFRHGDIFHLVLSEYYNQISDFSDVITSVFDRPVKKTQVLDVCASTVLGTET